MQGTVLEKVKNVLDTRCSGVETFPLLLKKELPALISVHLGSTAVLRLSDPEVL